MAHSRKYYDHRQPDINAVDWAAVMEFYRRYDNKDIVNRNDLVWIVINDVDTFPHIVPEFMEIRCRTIEMKSISEQLMAM